MRYANNVYYEGKQRVSADVYLSLEEMELMPEEVTFLKLIRSKNYN